MRKMPSSICLIPARGGSKRIPRKNILDFFGKPLLWYTLQAAKKSRYIDEIYISTEDKEIENIVKKFGVKTIERPKALAKDESSVLSVIKHSLAYLEKKGKKINFLVLLPPTSPLRKPATIDRAIKKFINLKLDALYSVVIADFPPEWLLTTNNERLVFSKKVPFKKSRKQDQKIYYQINGAIYIFSKKCIKSSKYYPYSPNNSYIIMDKLESFDIDSPEDIKLVKAILKK